MRTESFSEDHIGPLVAGMRLREREALEYMGGVEAFKNKMELLDSTDHCSLMTLINDQGLVAAVLGMNRKWPGCAEFWAYTTDFVEHEPIGFLRETKILFEELYSTYGLKRAEATVAVSYDKSIEWLTWLGFEMEGRMKKYGFDFEDHYMMARTD